MTALLHRPTARDLSWLDRALCRGQDASMFFSLDEQEQRKARAVCRECPVREECLDWAIAERMDGVFGGTNEYERRRLRRRRQESRR